MVSETNKKLIQELINNIGVEVGEIGDIIDDLKVNYGVPEVDGNDFSKIIKKSELVQRKFDFMVQLLKNF